jgi:hypothetical protein
MLGQAPSIQTAAAPMGFYFELSAPLAARPVARQRIEKHLAQSVGLQASDRLRGGVFIRKEVLHGRAATGHGGDGKAVKKATFVSVTL